MGNIILENEYSVITVLKRFPEKGIGEISKYVEASFSSVTFQHDCPH
jgi:hypothetical protein